MESITFVTSNKGKAAEVKAILAQAGIKMDMASMDLLEIRSESLEEVSCAKAKAAFEEIGRPLIVEDTGIFFIAYNNFPGAYTKSVFHSIGHRGIMRLLNGADRRAQFRTVVTLIEAGKYRQFTGICNGRISENASKNYDPSLPYDSIFIPDGEGRCFSDMSKQEKSRFSHRAKALGALIKAWRSE